MYGPPVDLRPFISRMMLRALEASSENGNGRPARMSNKGPKKTKIELCVICLGDGRCKRCPCGAGWYCSRDCQKKHWYDEHKWQCPVHVARKAVRSGLNSNELVLKVLEYI